MEIGTVMIMLSVVGSFVGLAGYQANRDKKNMGDAEWKGEINAKLDVILGINPRIDKMEEKIEKHETAIEILKGKADSAHLRLDKHKDFCERQLEKGTK
ncbi:hypothetical protein MASR2M70_10910 [Bacillota bacterium]